MKKSKNTFIQLIVFAIIFLCTGYLRVNAQAIVTQFDKTYGGNGLDQLFAGQQTSDGGYIFGGRSTSGINGDKTAPNKGFWIVKTDINGDIEFDKAYSGSGGESLNALEQTTDGGYILGGNSGSNIGGDKSENSRGGTDFWIVKIDSIGNVEFDKTFGGSGFDLLLAVQQTSDGGYILGGMSSSGIGGDKSEANRGSSTSLDFWIVKIDANGNKEFDKTIGGDRNDFFSSLTETTDGGFVLAGSSGSNVSGEKSQPRIGGADGWVVKVDANGNVIWDRSLGSVNQGFGFRSVQLTNDGGYILAGGAGVFPDPRDFWLVKLDDNGNQIFENTFGGDDYDEAFALDLTSDGGYIIGGSSQSNVSGDKTEPSRGSLDYWLVKTDANGNIEWDKTFGGNGIEELNSLQETVDGGYIIGGTSRSGVSGDKTEPNRGGIYDFWVLKIIDLCVIPGTCETISGTVYVDNLDANCAFDLGDAGIGGKLIQMEDANNTFLKVSRSSGDYSFNLPASNYTASLVTDETTEQPNICGSPGLTYQVNLSIGNPSEGNNFFIKPLCEVVGLNRVLSVSPFNNALGVSVSTKVELEYGCSVNPSSFNDASSFIVSGAISGQHTGSFAFSLNNTVVTFTPTVPFIKGEKVTIIATDQLSGPSETPIPFVSVFNVNNNSSPGIFTAPLQYITGNSPNIIAAGDLNGDGLTDLAISNGADNTFSVLINDNGNPGTFLPKIDYATNLNPLDIKMADLDMDGFVDIVVTNLNSSDVSVYLNNGSGIFSTKTDYTTLPTPKSIDIQDLDGDGFFDLVTGNLFEDRICILFNNGDGTFAPFIAKYAGHGTVSVALEDFNNDGNVDIMSTNFNRSIRILENTGGGSMESEKKLYDGRSGQGRSFWSDFNGDGLIDAVIATSVDYPDFVSVVKNQGPIFQTPADEYSTGPTPRHIYSADIDGDGDMDILATHKLDNYGHGISVLRNNGNGTFAEKEQYIVAGSAPTGILVADLDGDGTGDMIVANSDLSTISVFRNPINPHLIQGTVFNDLDQNSFRDFEEFGVSNWGVRLLPNDAEVLTDETGVFEFHVADAGTYTIESVLRSGWNQTFPPTLGSHSVTITNSGPDFNHLVTNSHINFGVQTNTCGNCLEVTLTIVPIWPVPPFCDPATATTYVVTVTNNCGTLVSGIEVELILNNSICFNNVTNQQTLCNSSFNEANDFVFGAPTTTVEWDQTSGNFTPGQSCTFSVDVFFSPGLCPFGTNVDADVFAGGNEGPPLNNLCIGDDNLSEAAQCSWDPNDIVVTPPGCGLEGYVTTTDTLTYRINFQNTGTAATNRVIIRDTLGVEFDISTLQLTNSSHTFDNFQIVSGSVLEWTFGTQTQSFNLPDSTSDPIGSKGFVEFQILMQQTLSPGIQIINSADIFFDGNPPVKTNRTLNTISEDPALVAAIEGDTSICQGETTTLIATGGTAYIWSTGQTTRSITTGEAGSYAVTVFFDNSCESTASVKVEVRQSAVADFVVATPCVSVGLGVDFAYTGGTSNSALFQWNFGPNASITNSTDENPTGIVFNSVGNELVELTITRLGCSSTISKTVEILNATCGNINDKIFVCHLPPAPGNPNNPLTLCINPSSVSNHLAHGDLCGPCGGSKSSGNSTAVVESLSEESEINYLMEDERTYDAYLEAYPNPFSGVTTIKFSLPTAEIASISLFNISGEQITVLFSGEAQKDFVYDLEFDAKNLASGIYYYRLITATKAYTKKLVLLK